MPDRDLFWVTRDYARKLADARHTRPAVVFMGDSCTEFGTWPQLTLDRLAARDPSLARGVSLAVGGWSSEQGLRQFRRDVLPLHPRLVTIYYGWNDHWLAFGEPDADVHANAVSYWLAEHLRLAQLVVKARLGTSVTPSAGGSFRHPLDRYRVNIETLGRLTRAAGIRAVFITAPTSHDAAGSRIPGAPPPARSEGAGPAPRIVRAGKTRLGGRGRWRGGLRCSNDVHGTSGADRAVFQSRWHPLQRPRVSCAGRHAGAVCSA